MGEPDTSPERPTEPPAEPPVAPTARSGLSPAAWGALAVLGAAVITGVVTLVTHFSPSPVTPDSVARSVTSRVVAGASLSTPAPVPVPGPRSQLIERLVGSWAGEAKERGVPYRMSVVINDTCVEGGVCGSMRTELVPCLHTLRLVGISADVPEFSFGIEPIETASSACYAHADGDRFALAGDVLSYHKGYDGGVTARLYRVK